MNIAYTEKYIEHRKAYDKLFTDEYFRGNKTYPIGDGFSVHSRSYSGKFGGYDAYLSEKTLTDSSGSAVYTWRNLDTDSEFVRLIKHSNGKHYLIFRRELGYSVLEIDSGRDFHYVPSQSFEEDREKFEETFIWIDVHYNDKTDLLAVEGCFWAAPYSTVLIDFSEPLREHPAEIWYDLYDHFDLGYWDIDFKCWDENNDLWVKAGNQETEKIEELCLSSDVLKKLIEKRIGE